MTTKRRLYDIKETAAQLGISHYFLYKLVEKRQVSYVKLGRKIMFSEKQIEKIINSNAVEARGG